MAASWMDLNTTDPKKVAQQNRQWDMSTGQGLMDQNGAFATQRGQTADQTSSQLQGLLDPSGTMSRLDSWMTPLANGQGGYNSSELSQIQMTPEQQRDMVTSAGVSAGLRNSAAVGAAERASNAAGGNPQALATYRARAAMQGSADAGDAMTNARVAASNTAAQRAQTVGNARLGQQQQGLNYYGGLQGQGAGYLSGLEQQQAGQQESALNRQAQNYSTATGAANSAGQLAQSASQNPTMFDKVMGGVSGALGALEDGAVTPGKQSAVIAENGPEKVVSTRPQFMEDGGFPSGPSLYRGLPAPVAPAPIATPAAPARDLGNTTTNADGSLTFTPGADSQPLVAQKRGGFMGFLDNLKAGAAQQQQQQQQPQPAANPSMNTAQTAGRGLGTLARLMFLEDGDVMPQEKQGVNGLFTQPTRVNLMPGEAVVPLSYRGTAKVRPSAAGLPAAPVTFPYRSQRGVNAPASARP